MAPSAVPPYGGDGRKGLNMAAEWTAISTSAVGYAADILADFAPVLIPLAAIAAFVLVAVAIRSIFGGGK